MSGANCVDENHCETCTDSEGISRKLDEKWNIEACKSCTCQKGNYHYNFVISLITVYVICPSFLDNNTGKPVISCVATVCQTDLHCEAGFEPVPLPGSDPNACCPSLQCVPVAVDCSNVVIPDCKDDQVKD